MASARRLSEEYEECPTALALEYGILDLRLDVITHGEIMAFHYYEKSTKQKREEFDKDVEEYKDILDKL